MYLPKGVSWKGARNGRRRERARPIASWLEAGERSARGGSRSACCGGWRRLLCSLRTVVGGEHEAEARKSAAAKALADALRKVRRTQKLLRQSRDLMALSLGVRRRPIANPIRPANGIAPEERKAECSRSTVSTACGCWSGSRASSASSPGRQIGRAHV